MSTFNRLDFFRETYYKEIERKCDLNNDLSLPVGIISVLSTVFFFFLSNFNYQTNKIISVVFIVISLLGAISIVLSIIYLILAYDSYRAAKPYDYIGYPNEIAKFHSDYKKYFEEIKVDISEIEAKADKELEEYLIEAYTRTSTVNMAKNDMRSGQLHRSKRFILSSFISLLLAFVPFLFNSFTKADAPHRVEISNKLKFDIDSLHFNSKNIFMAEDRDSASEPPKPPKPPGDRHIKGNEPLPPRPTPPIKPKVK